MKIFKINWIYLLISIIISVPCFTIEVVSNLPYEKCMEYFFENPIPVFKDPALFLSILNNSYYDPHQATEELEKEDPILTMVKGAVTLRRLGPAREFKHKDFGIIAEIYENADPRLKRIKKKKSVKIIPIMFCGDNSPYGGYKDSIAFILEKDFEKELTTRSGSPPPSVKNIPEYGPKKIEVIKQR